MQQSFASWLLSLILITVKEANLTTVVTFSDFWYLESYKIPEANVGFVDQGPFGQNGPISCEIRTDRAWGRIGFTTIRKVGVFVILAAVKVGFYCFFFFRIKLRDLLVGIFANLRNAKALGLNGG